MFIILVFFTAMATSVASEAEVYYRAALERARTFGEQDPRFASAARDLAWILSQEGKSAEAKRLLETALPVLEASMGKEHKIVAISRYQLARAHAHLGEYGEAEKHFGDAIPLAERAMGESHPELGTMLSELGALYRVLGRCQDSQKVLFRAVKIQQSILGESSVLTHRSRAQLGATYHCLGEYSKAISLLRQEIAVFEKIPGQGADLASALVTLGNVHFALNQLNEAGNAWQRALIALGDQSEMRRLKAHTLCNLGTLKSMAGHAEEGETLMLEGVAILEADAGWSGDLGPVLNSLANLYVRGKKLDRAEETYQRALDITSSTFGPTHSAMSILLMGFGRLRIAQKRFDEAAPFFQRALDIDERTIGPRHPYYAEHLTVYAALLRKMKRKDEAKMLKAKAQAIIAENNINTFAGATVDLRELRRR